MLQFVPYEANFVSCIINGKTGWVAPNIRKWKIIDTVGDINMWKFFKDFEKLTKNAIPNLKSFNAEWNDNDECIIVLSLQTPKGVVDGIDGLNSLHALLNVLSSLSTLLSIDMKLMLYPRVKEVVICEEGFNVECVLTTFLHIIYNHLPDISHRLIHFLNYEDLEFDENTEYYKHIIFSDNIYISKTVKQ